ncbi:uncharacterized protein LOC119735838 [Patiria miniata]|uniref:DUF3987 domain-containing protein n=1 Tax=Patiria miniata TaxID=46514 RepID=A0A914APM9_PATMI|nr:uncharacterized protein LOC119735838 [Patiria miniata]
MSQTKISRQREETWCSLHQRLSSMEFDLQGVFPRPVATYVQTQADSLSTCAGYVLSSILTTVCFLISLQCDVQLPHGKQKANMFTIFIGPPSTGKTQAIRAITTDPLLELFNQKDIANPMLNKCTAAGLGKKLADNKSGFIVSSEISDALGRLTKADDCDPALLCELFSGEPVTFTFATKNDQTIPSSLPFAILGGTQMQPAATLLTAFNKGQGLLDRFLIHVPQCLRPTPDDTVTAQAALQEHNFSFSDLVSAMYDILDTINTFTFTDAAKRRLSDINANIIADINNAIKNGLVPPKSKTFDFVVRLAAGIHVFVYTCSAFLDGQDNIGPPPPEIDLSSLEAALTFVEHCEAQKTVFMQVLSNMISPVLEDVRLQPSQEDVLRAIILFPGRIVTYRSFTSSGPRCLRQTTSVEFQTAITKSATYGKQFTIKVPRCKPIMVFLKKHPDTITDWQTVNEEVYRARFDAPCSVKITQNIQAAVVAHEDLPEDYFRVG